MSVPIVAAVALLAALYQAMFAVRVINAASGTRTVKGLLFDLSDQAWVITAVLAGFLAVGYVWVARGLMAGQREARSTAVWLAAIGIVFGLVELPFGAFALILSAASFFLLMSFPVKDWYGVPRRRSK